MSNKEYIKVKYLITIQERSIEIYCDDMKNLYGRNSFGNHCWYYLETTPYREIINRCPDNIVFIICDKKGNKLIEDGNSPEFEVSYLSLIELYEFSIKKVLTAVPILKIEGFARWILQYIDKRINDKNRVNFIRYWNETIEKEVLESFKFLGEEYAIFKVKKDI